MDELERMEIPLNAPLGASLNKRFEPPGGERAADFPQALVVEEPINANVD
jgi:N-acetylglucosamine-6-sulfatase